MSDVMRVSDFFDRAYQENDRYWWRDQDRYAGSPVVSVIGRSG
jgi:hypothetical protein